LSKGDVAERQRDSEKAKKAKLMMGNFAICMGLGLQAAWAQGLRPYKCRFCLLKEFTFVGKTLPNLCKPQ
jgi:hypothetical protein